MSGINERLQKWRAKEKSRKEEIREFERVNKVRVKGNRVHFDKDRYIEADVRDPTVRSQVVRKINEERKKPLKFTVGSKKEDRQKRVKKIKTAAAKVGQTVGSASDRAFEGSSGSEVFGSSQPSWMSGPPPFGSKTSMTDMTPVNPFAPPKPKRPKKKGKKKR